MKHKDHLEKELKVYKFVRANVGMETKCSFKKFRCCS
jgi:hypothetical protein